MATNKYDWEAAVKAATRSANKQKNTGTYQTTSGGTVKGNTGATQAVQSAAQQQQSGTLKTTSGGTVKSSGSTPSNKGTSGGTTNHTVKITYKPKTTTASVETEAYKSLQDKTGEKENPNTGASGNGQSGNNANQLPANRYQLPANDPGFSYEKANNLLAKYNMTEADLGGLPVEALYLGNNKYALPYLLNKPDDYTFLSGSNLITVGDYKKALLNGTLMNGNEAAYNDWIGTVAKNDNAVLRDPDRYKEEVEEDTIRVGDGITASKPNIGTLPDYAQGVIDAQNAKYQAMIDALNGQRGMLDEQYDANAADLYAQYRRSSLALPEMLAGTATGIADSMTLQNNLNYQNNLYGNELERANALNNLLAQENQYRADAALQAAQTEADWAQMLYQQQMNEQALQREYEMQKLAADREYELALMQLQNKKVTTSGSNSGNKGNGTTGSGGNNGGDTSGTTQTTTTLPGITKPIPEMTKDEVVTYLTKRFYTNLTPDNIVKALNQLMDAGLPDSVAKAVGEKYGMEML